MKRSDLENLLKDMSLDEKIMQLVQLPGQTYEENAAVTGMADSDVSEETKMLAGSTLGLYGAEKIKKIQKEYMEKHPHHIPLLFMLDVIHGHKTVFPCPIAQGATFDPDISEKGAAVQAMEASADGVHVTFSPMADLVRDARWGRDMESTGEDPYLNGIMTSAMVRGYQGDDISEPGHVAACVKHFAAYGASEAGRDYNNVELSEYALRDQYLRAYEEDILAGAKMVMTSFNTINGKPSSGNKWLMRDVLRGDMGFDGVLISDWGAIGEMVNWGFAENLEEAAYKAMQAGVDIDMCTKSYSDNLKKLVLSGKISEKLVDDAVMRILSLKNELGLFEDPYHGASEDRSKEVTLSEKSRELARDAVRKSLVLLENKNKALPFDNERDSKIAFIGPYVDEKNLRSSWAISSDPETTVTLKDAARECLTGFELKFADGCTMLNNDTVLGWGVYNSDSWEKENESLLKDAIEAAAWADTVVMCLGEHVLQSGESTSHVTIRIPEIQLQLLKKIKESGKKIITLIFAGRPLELDMIAKMSDALLICWRPGTEGGHGIIDVLSGKYSPQGKLPMSFPWYVGQEPIYYNHFSTGREKPKEGPTNFTTRYLDSSNEPRYPFGYGLTYSRFELSDVKVSQKEISIEKSDSITAKVAVKNIGDAEATETVQLYIRDIAGSRVRPVRELKKFRKVTLKSGEVSEISFEITKDMLRFWTINDRFESEPGEFKAYIGFSSAGENEVSFDFKLS